jgi:hypothetical protein
LHSHGRVVGVDPDRLGILDRAEGAGWSWLVAVGDAFHHYLLELLELSRVGDSGGELEVLPSACVGLLEGAAHRDDAI